MTTPSNDPLNVSTNPLDNPGCRSCLIVTSATLSVFLVGVMLGGLALLAILH